MKSHITECFGFVPVREFGEFLKSDKIEILAIAIIAGSFLVYFGYLFFKVNFNG